MAKINYIEMTRPAFDLDEIIVVIEILLLFPFIQNKSKCPIYYLSGFCFVFWWFESSCFELFYFTVRLF